jgi:hypothetical protein
MGSGRLVERGLGVDEPFEFAPVEEDATAFGALVDGDFVALIRSLPLTLVGSLAVPSSSEQMRI